MMMYDTRNCGFRGLLRVLLALVVGLWVALPAHASFPATNDTPSGACTAAPCYEHVIDSSAGHAVGSTPRAVFDMFAAQISAKYGWAYVYVGNDSSSVQFSFNGTTSSVSYVTRAVSPSVPVYSCPANSSLSGSSCTCNSGLTQSGNTCVNPCAARAGTSAGEYSSPGSVSDGKYVYLCEVGLTDSCGLVVDYAFSADGVKTGHAKWSGQSCTPGTSDGTSESNAPPVSTTVPPEPGKPAPTPCKPGTFPGTVNGQSVCIEPSNKTPVETKKKTVEDDGTNTVKKESSTTCAAGACNTITTTTTTNNSTSSVNVTNNTKSEAKSDYCAANPNSSQCSVECQSATGTVGCAKLSTPKDGDLPTSDVDVPTVQRDGLAGFNIGHACPADLSYVIQGKTYKLSFKPACDVAPMVKPVVLLGAALSALFIVYASLVGKTS